MLLLGVSLMQAGKNEDDGPGWSRPADGVQVVQDILLRMIQHLGRNNDHVGLAIEACQILAWIVTRLIDAASIEERQKRSFSRWKVVCHRIPSARPEALADLGFLRPVKYLMSVVLPLCVLPYSHRTGTGIFCRSRSSRSWSWASRWAREKSLLIVLNMAVSYFRLSFIFSQIVSGGLHPPLADRKLKTKTQCSISVKAVYYVYSNLASPAPAIVVPFLVFSRSVYEASRLPVFSSEVSEAQACPYSLPFTKLKTENLDNLP